MIRSSWCMSGSKDPVPPSGRSETAAPVFSQVAEQTVIPLNIPPDVVRNQLANGSQPLVNTGQ